MKCKTDSSVLREINQFITELNCKNKIVTPFLHTYVHKKKGGKIKYMFSKLVDGVHPTIYLSRSWFKHMEKVISENEKKLKSHGYFKHSEIWNSYITEICLARLLLTCWLVFFFIGVCISCIVYKCFDFEFTPFRSSWESLAACWFHHVGSSYFKWFNNWVKLF